MPRRPSPRLCSRFLCAYCSKKLPERAPTKSQLCVLSIIDQLRECARQLFAYAQLSPLYPSLPLRHSRDKLSQALSSFSVLQGDGKLGGTWERGYSLCTLLFQYILITVLQMQEFITVRVCNSHMVSIAAMWIGWHRQSAVNIVSCVFKHRSKKLGFCCSVHIANVH